MHLIVNIDVDDLDKAIAFYTAGLGLTPSRRLFGGTVAELSGASSPIQLLLKESGSAALPNKSAARNYQRHWTPVHLDVVVDDISLAVKRAVEAGATLEGAVQSHRWGRLATLSDPFGHGFCLLQFAGRGYDDA